MGANASAPETLETEAPPSQVVEYTEQQNPRGIPKSLRSYDDYDETQLARGNNRQIATASSPLSGIAQRQQRSGFPEIDSGSESEESDEDSRRAKMELAKKTRKQLEDEIIDMNKPKPKKVAMPKPSTSGSFGGGLLGGAMETPTITNMLRSAFTGGDGMCDADQLPSEVAVAPSSPQLAYPTSPDPGSPKAVSMPSTAIRDQNRQKTLTKSSLDLQKQDEQKNDGPPSSDGEQDDDQALEERYHNAVRMRSKDIRAKGHSMPDHVDSRRIVDRTKSVVASRLSNKLAENLESSDNAMTAGQVERNRYRMWRLGNDHHEKQAHDETAVKRSEPDI